MVQCYRWFIQLICVAFLQPLGPIQPLEQKFINPDYDERIGPDNDIALVKLQTRSEITPVDMDDGTESYTESDKFWTMGFRSFNNGDRSNYDVLHHAELSYVTNEVCSDNYAEFAELTGVDFVTDNMMCAADLEQGIRRGCYGGKPKIDLCY